MGREDRKAQGFGPHVDTVFRVECRMADGVLFHVMDVAEWAGVMIGRLLPHTAPAHHPDMRRFSRVPATPDNARQRSDPGQVRRIAPGLANAGTLRGIYSVGPPVRAVDRLA